ncbi:uncharacterized protein LOC134754719 [Cydia strobilella]|uniref:uncharacterized protein LOC134754719 n=1 Tax=Cydia strobilella TaxID=1100964 RepID=UPI0030046ACD
MAEERLSGLALLNIHKDTNLDIDQIINVFAKKKHHVEYERGTCEPADSAAQYDEYMYDDAVEDKLETESAILADPASHVVQCTAEVQAEAEIPAAPSDAHVQEDLVPAETNTNDEIAVINEDFDHDLLRALGEFEAETVEWGDNIHEDIAKHFQHILLNGLKKEAKEELHKKYLFPKNVPFSKAPTLNPEIAAMLTEASRNRDNRILAKQQQIGKALSGLGKAMTSLLKKEPNIAEAKRTLSDVGKLVADAHFAETETRRSDVIPLVDKSLIDPFKDRKRDSFLFGEKLGDLVKSSRGIKKTGQLIQAAPTASASSSGLNWRPPSSRPRPQRGGQLPYPGRGGGLRGYSYYQPRRRAPPAHNTAFWRQTASTAGAPAAEATSGAGIAPVSQPATNIDPQINPPSAPTPYPGSERVIRESFIK